MVFNWERYIDLAKKLIEHSKNDGFLREAYLRASISRAYYGAYWIARDYLTKKGKTIPDRDSHKFVHEEYQKSSNPMEKKIGEDLKRLKRQRIHADYLNSPQISMDDANAALDTARKILKRLKQIGA